MGSKLRNSVRSHWTDEELTKLRDIWGTMRDADVAQALGKTISVVRFKATSLKLREEKGLRAGCRPGRITYPWTREEDLVLIKNVGHLSIFELLELLPRRNRVAAERRCYELGFSPTQGTYTRGKIERDTGYDWRQIRRARDAIGQVWKRYGIRKYMISFEQVQDIIEYLRTEKRKWSMQYDLDNCIKCKTSGTGERDRHSGDGFCKRCLTGDSRIIVHGIGICRIDEMVGKGEFRVWSGLGWRVTTAVCSGIQPVVEVHVSNGSVVKMTGTHSVVTARGMVHAHNLDGMQLPIQLPDESQVPGLQLDELYGGFVGKKSLTAVVVDAGAKEPVYDLVNVGEERQFVASGISVSNCWDKRRHRRAWIVKSFSNGRAVLMTQWLWEQHETMSHERDIQPPKERSDI